MDSDFVGAHHFLSPTAANHITHLGVFFGTLIPFYLALRLILSENGALIATLLFSVYPHAHGSGGWDYHNAIAGAFYAWSYYFLTLGWKQFPEQDSKIFFIAGLFIGLLLQTNVFFVLFAPIMVLHLWALQGGIRSNQIARTLLLILGGMIAVTVILGLINWYVGRKFLFFKPLLLFLISFAGDANQQKPWWHPWSASWTSGALYLSFTLAMVGTSVVALLTQFVYRPNRDNAQNVLCSINLQLIFAVAIWVILQSSGHTFLDYDYFAYPLIFPAFAALAAAVSRNNLHGSTKIPTLLKFVFVLLLVLPLSFGANALGDMATDYLGFIRWDIVPSALVFFIASVVLFVSNRLSLITLAIALLGIANVNLNVDRTRAMILSSSEVNHYYGFGERHCSMRKDVFDTAIQLSGKLRKASMSWSKVVLWNNSDEVLKARPECSPIVMKAHLAGPLMELGYGAVRPPWEMMPAISAIGADEFKSWATQRKVLVLLTQNNNAIIEMNDRARMLGLSAKIGSAGVIDIGEARLRIDLLSFQ